MFVINSEKLIMQFFWTISWINCDLKRLKRFKRLQTTAEDCDIIIFAEYVGFVQIVLSLYA